MIKRIKLDETNSSVSYLFNPPVIASISNESGNEISEAGSMAGSTQSEANPSNEVTVTQEDTEKPVSPAFAEFEYELTEEKMPAYSSSRYSYSVREITVTVPEADKSIVAGWFGNAGASGGTVSDTMVKRMTSSVIGAINDFFGDSSRGGLFTRPFKLGYALQTSDGKLVAVHHAGLVVPNAQAPIMAIRDAAPQGDRLITLTEIRNLSFRLTVSIPAFTISEDIKDRITNLVFFVTEQCNPLTGDEEVTGVRTYRIESGNCPGWYYPRLAANLVADRARAASDFRIIGSIPVNEALQGVSNYRLPDSRLDLTDFKNFPKAENVNDPDSSDNPDSPDNPDPDKPDDPRFPFDPGTPVSPVPTGMRVRSYALDLGNPEKDKRIKAVTVRGIFSRHPDNVILTLYGAHHIPGEELGTSLPLGTKVPTDTGRWRKIARAHGPHIRFLRGIRYRFLRVDVQVPYPSRIDALTFLYS